MQQESTEQPVQSVAPVLSIVTGTINRPEQLERLCFSVRMHTTVDAEFIIMDASDEPNRAFRSSDNPRIRYIHEKPRLGHTRGYNAAFQLACGEYAIWLNDDAEVLPGYDQAGIDLLTANPDIGLGAYYYQQLPRQQFHVNMVYSMIFANFGIIRRELGNRIGWFDEDFYMYGADNSLTFRVLLAGLGIATVPGKSIIHHVEHDAVRIENEKTKNDAVGLLHSKYGGHRAQMQLTYAKTRHMVGPRVLA